MHPPPAHAAAPATRRRLESSLPAMPLAALCLCVCVCVGLWLPAACAAPQAQAAQAPKPPATAAAVRDDDAPDTVTYGRRDDVQRFGADVAARDGLDAAAVQALLAQARFIPVVTRYVMPAPTGTAKNWRAYRRRFVDPARIVAGVAFWRENARWLDLAEQRYGVPPEIVVGILGVETYYGRQVGSFRQIDALATLAFDFPGGRSDRSAYFKQELATWLADHVSEGDAALALKSSYAGARGLPQFMPSSERRLGADFDGDGRVDLAGSTADAIGSVANYLVSSGWKRGQPTRYGVTPPEDIARLALLLAPDIVPTFSAADLTRAGARLDTAGLADSGPLALVRLDNADDAPTYVAGTANFYAITRYNQSSYYALAVVELGEAVKAAR